MKTKKMKSLYMTSIKVLISLKFFKDLYRMKINILMK